MDADFIDAVHREQLRLTPVPSPALCTEYRRCHKLIDADPENDQAWATLNAISTLLEERLGLAAAVRLMEGLEK
jgi:hypothetical protein